MDRPFTNSERFLSLDEKKKEEKINFLREKRKNLQVKRKKASMSSKLPVIDCITQEHKLFFLGLSPEVKKLF